MPVRSPDAYAPAIPSQRCGSLDEIDELSAKARRQAAELNRTLDDLAKLGVTASVGSGPGVFSPIIIARVRLVLTDPAHQPGEPT